MHAIVLWATVSAAIVVFLLTAVQVSRALRELRRLKRRFDDYGDLPVVRAADRAQRDGARLQAASEQLERLALRGQIAIGRIRHGPIPPGFIIALRRVRAEIEAYRASAAR